MAFNAMTHGIITQVLDRIYEKQGPAQEKANTVSTAVGTIITAVLGALAYLLEQGTELPSWTPWLVVALGAIGTVFRVSKTKNGVTQSLKKQIEDELNQIIDERAEHSPPVTSTPGTVVPPAVLEHDESEANRIADDLDGLAKRIADRHRGQ